MPDATFSGEGFHDPLPPLLPDGIPVWVTIQIDTASAKIRLDLRDNIDCMDNGLNLSQACAINNAVAGVFNCLPADIPRNAGSFRCIELQLREGSAVGIPTFPHS